MPSPGLVTLWHSPGGPGIRMESHVYSGYKVPPYYDSMIGKLIAHGETRDAAFARMKNALSEIVIEGIKTNVPLHQEIFQHCSLPGRWNGYPLPRKASRPDLTWSGTGMDWRQFVMDLESLDPATVEELFDRLGASSVTLSDAGDDPVLEPGPGETPLWTNTRITGLFSGDVDMQRISQLHCSSELGLATLPAHRIEALADRAWEREWLRDFGANAFRRTLVDLPDGQPGR